MKLELALALYQYAQNLLAGTALVLVALAFWLVDELDKKRIKYAKYCGVLALVFASLALLPGIEDLYKMRIALIKYEISSPENVKGAVETIERIGAKLECKYFGCKDDKK